MQKLLSHLTPNQQTVLVIICLPLILMAVGLWQLHRAPTPADMAKEAAQIQITIDTLQEIARTKGQYSAVKLSDGKSYAVSLLISRAQAEKTRLANSGFWQSTVPTWLARVTAAFGALGSLLGGLMLLHIRRMGAQALKSRAKLLRTFGSGQKLLPWFLAALAVLLFTAAACSLGYEVVRYAAEGHLSRGDEKLIGAGGIFVLVLLYFGARVVWNLIKASQAVFKPSTLTIMGRAVTQDEAPRLWGFVRDLAGRVKAEMPDSIVVGLNECFFVTENAVKLSSGKELPRGRVLYLPLPYMAFMSMAEVAAVIGHELAHFTGDDTEYSLHFAPIYSTAINNLVAVHEAGSDEIGQTLTRPVMMMGEFFLRSFNEAVQYWSRQRELAADQMGARVSSRDAAAMALVRVSVLAPRINEALAACWSERGHGEGVLAETRRLIAEKGLDDPEPHLEEAQAHPTDSHPTTRQRIEALGVKISPPMLEHCRDPRGNDLLIELGLEADNDGAPVTGAGQVAASAVPVTSALEAEFSNAAQSEREEYVTFLREVVRQVSGKCTIQEGARFEAGIIIALGLAAVIGPLFAKAAPPWVVPVFAAGGIAVIAGGAYLLNRRRKPLMTLTPEGLLFANLTTPLPWTVIENFNVHVFQNYGSSTFSTTLQLAEGYTPPDFSGDRRVKYKKKKNQIVFSFLGLAGMTADAFAGQIGTYRQAALARAELEKLGQAV